MSRPGAAIGIGLALATGLSACSSDSFKPSVGIEIQATRDVVLYPNQNDIRHPVTTLRSGGMILAVCYEDSATLGVDSVRVVTDNGIDHAFVGHAARVDGQWHEEPNFNLSPHQLDERLKCHAGESSDTQTSPGDPLGLLNPNVTTTTTPQIIFDLAN